MTERVIEKPPLVLVQATLERIEDLLQTLCVQQADLTQQVEALTGQTDALRIAVSQGQASRHDPVTVTPPHRRRPGARWPRPWVLGTGLAVLLVLGGGLWRSWQPDAQATRHVEWARAVHQVLGQHYRSLPKEVQGALAQVYRTYGLQEPGGRK